MEQGCICVFAKPPRPGQVKTRLIAAYGNGAAAMLAKAMLQDTWAAVVSLPWARPVLASTECAPPSFAFLKCEVWPQGGGDLGARLERVLSRALEDFPLALAIGSDTPGLPEPLLAQARSGLREADAVLGPCEDGGFYLLGLRRCPSGLLAGISWSEPCTFALTLERLRQAGLSVRVLDPWFDIDRPEDVVRLQTMISEGAVRAPRTAEILKRLPLNKKTGRRFTCSAIVPILNEHECLPHLLRDLRNRDWIDEVIVVDGGSTDGTREWLDKQPFACVVDAPAARGAQINAGAKLAKGDMLLLLHADCTLPPDAETQIHRALQIQQASGGCFCVRFSETGHFRLSVVAAGINFRTRVTHTATGDQAIFVRRHIFEKIGGCRDWPLFEDVDLVRRIKALGRFAVIQSPVTVSARRYLTRGVFKTALLIYALRLAYWMGVSPLTLKRWFADVRPRRSLPSPGSFAEHRHKEVSHAAHRGV